MAAARFLIRLDDACPTLHRERWRAIETLLDNFGIRPIVGVIPRNEDPGMVCDQPDGGFWERLRSWQQKGWELALHGYSHVMRPTLAKQVLPFYARSEFSGLSFTEQAAKVRAGVEVLHAHGVRPRVFVAPGHSFDRVTLQVIRHETDIRIVSDGIALHPYYRDGLYFVPQQLWEFSPRSFGVWTICVHPNTCTEGTLLKLRTALEAHRSCFVALGDLTLTERRRSPLDWAYSLRFWRKRRLDQASRAQGR